VLVDDGLATGATMRAAVAGARMAGSIRITVAVPVGASGACDLVAADADHVVCAKIPRVFGAVGNWYRDFSQLDDDDVRSVLDLRG
jgi:predicted phosphoribosyltransferase